MPPFRSWENWRRFWSWRPGTGSGRTRNCRVDLSPFSCARRRKIHAAEHGFRLFEGGEGGAYILQTDPRAAESRVAWANCSKFLLATGLLGAGGRRRFLLLHGALLEHSGSAAVLLAPGGTGKSTTLRRHRLHGGRRLRR